MSAPIDTGGPAFPDNSLEYPSDQRGGMSLRDYFAAHALSGWAAGRNNGDAFNSPDSSKADFVAASCYLYADAMIVARMGGQGA